MDFCIQKDCSPHGAKTPKDHSPFLLCICLFHFARARPTRQMVNLCMSPDSDLSTLPTFPNVSNVQWYPSLQWRDRAGFSPASILASCPAARSLQSAAQEEHKLSFVILFSLVSIAQAGNKYNPLAMYNMQCAAKKLHIFAEIKQKRV